MITMVSSCFLPWASILHPSVLQQAPLDFKTYLRRCWGAFNNYVDRILPNVDHDPFLVDSRGHCKCHLPFVLQHKIHILYNLFSFPELIFLEFFLRFLPTCTLKRLSTYLTWYFTDKLTTSSTSSPRGY